MRSRLVIAALALFAASVGCGRTHPQEANAAPVGRDSRVNDGRPLDQITGTLERADAKGLVIRTRQGEALTFGLARGRRVFDGKRQVSLRALLPEEQVRVFFVTDGTERLAQEVDILQIPDGLRRAARRPLVK